MRILLILFFFSISTSLYSQDTSFSRLPNIDVYFFESLSEQLDSQKINVRKYKLNEVCTFTGPNSECKKRNKLLSKMVKYFDRVNTKTLSTGNKHGTWTYRLEHVDENTVIIIGNKAVSMNVNVRYEFKKR